MTTTDSVFDSRSTDLSYPMQTWVTGQTGRKQKLVLESPHVQSDHKINSTDSSKVQGFKSRCRSCKQNRLICKRGSSSNGPCLRCSEEGLICVGESARGRESQFSDDESALPRYGRGKLSISSIGAKFPYICPFYLRDPERWREKPSCSGDGWVDFGTLKEHIFRAHKLPVSCQRCCTEFKKTTELMIHLLYTNENKCEKTRQQLPIAAGYDKEQEKALRALNSIGLKPFEKWSEMWKILFPGDPDSDIPDPSAYSSLSRYLLKVRETLPVAQPGLSLNAQGPNNNLGESTPTSGISSHPFVHRAGRAASVPATRPVSLASVADLSLVGSNDVVGRKSTEHQERPSERWFQNYQETQRDKFTSTECVSLSKSQQQTLQSDSLILRTNPFRRVSIAPTPALALASTSLAPHQSAKEPFQARNIRTNYSPTQSSSLPAQSSSTTSLQPWPYHTLKNADNSSDGAFTPSTPSETSESNSPGSVYAIQCQSTEQLAQPPFSTRYAHGEVTSRPANVVSRPSRPNSIVQTYTNSNLLSTGNPQRQPNTNRQLPDDENSEDSDDDEDEERRPPESNGGIPLSSYNKVKLACPYYARAPLKDYKYRSCYAPGWNTVHRVKEHVYRRHALRPVCPRCWDFFENKDRLNDHIKAAERCESKTLSFSLCDEGFDERQEKELRKRRKNQSRTEKEKWKEMYQVLFPDDDYSAIPDPCHGAPTPFDQHMKCEMPRQLVREISALIQQHHGTISPDMKEGIARIPEKAYTAAKYLYHPSSLTKNNPGELSQGLDTGDVPLASMMGYAANNHGIVPSATTRRASVASYTPPSTMHPVQPLNNHVRPTDSNTQQTIPSNRQSQAQNHSESQFRRSSTTNTTSHGQHQYDQPLLGQGENTINWGSMLEPTSNIPYAPGHFTQQQFASNPTRRPTISEMGSIQPAIWNNNSQQIRPYPTPRPPTSTPYTRPGTTPPIASSFQYGPPSDYPSNPTPFTTPVDHQGFLAPNIRRNSYADPQSTQGYFLPSQPTVNFPQSTIPDYSPFSARPLSQNFLTERQQPSMAPTQLHFSARGRNLNPFGTNFSRIDEDNGEQTDEPDYQGVGQNMDQRP